MIVVACPMELVTANCAVVAPAGTVTDAGSTKLTQSLLARATTAPPAGAGAVNVTVPVETLPKIIVVGFMATRASAAGPAGFTVSVAVLATPL